MIPSAGKANPGWIKKIAFGLLALGLIFSAGSLVFIKITYDQNFPRFDPAKYSGNLHYSDLDGYSRSQVTFPSGKNDLTGYLYGQGNSQGLVVIAPGLGEGADTFLAEIAYFVDHGWRVFTYDPTGSFASQGKSTLGLPQSLVDLRAALDYLQTRADSQGLPLMLYGHSWGAYAVAAILPEGYNVSAVASISGFNSPKGLLTEQLRVSLGWLAPLEVPFGQLYQRLLFGNDATATAIGGINSGDTPVLIVHGDADESITYAGASIIAQRERISNPNATTVTRSIPGQNDHNHLLRSLAAIQYRDAKNQEYRAIFDQYGGDIPDDVRAAYYAGVDPFQVSELDADFMDQINQFFLGALAKR